jgi:hypothetical protein
MEALSVGFNQLAPPQTPKLSIHFSDIYLSAEPHIYLKKYPQVQSVFHPLNKGGYSLSERTGEHAKYTGKV